jgi:hypothetical protein
MCCGWIIIFQSSRVVEKCATHWYARLTDKPRYTYSFILKEQAYRFYLTNLFNKNLDFDIIITKTREYFEIYKNYQEYLSK